MFYSFIHFIYDNNNNLEKQVATSLLQILSWSFYNFYLYKRMSKWHVKFKLFNCWIRLIIIAKGDFLNCLIGLITVFTINKRRVNLFDVNFWLNNRQMSGKGCGCRGGWSPQLMATSLSQMVHSIGDKLYLSSHTFFIECF